MKKRVPIALVSILFFLSDPWGFSQNSEDQKMLEQVRDLFTKQHYNCTRFYLGDKPSSHDPDGDACVPTKPLGMPVDPKLKDALQPPLHSIHYFSWGSENLSLRQTVTHRLSQWWHYPNPPPIPRHDHITHPFDKPLEIVVGAFPKVRLLTVTDLAGSRPVLLLPDCTKEFSDPDSVARCTDQVRDTGVSRYKAVIERRAFCRKPENKKMKDCVVYLSAVDELANFDKSFEILSSAVDCERFALLEDFDADLDAQIEPKRLPLTIDFTPDFSLPLPDDVEVGKMEAALSDAKIDLESKDMHQGAIHQLVGLIPEKMLTECYSRSNTSEFNFERCKQQLASFKKFAEEHGCEYDDKLLDLEKGNSLTKNVLCSFLLGSVERSADRALSARPRPPAEILALANRSDWEEAIRLSGLLNLEEIQITPFNVVASPKMHFCGFNLECKAALSVVIQEFKRLAKKESNHGFYEIGIFRPTGKGPAQFELRLKSKRH
ncbi:MAG: hypothetical protein AB1540_11445 [Bdellovibrionota bacterium]